MRYLILILLVIFVSCNKGKQESDSAKTPKIENPEEALKKVNKLLIEKDHEVIQNYVRRRGWEMKRSSTGLWYKIVRNGSSTDVKKGDGVNIWYQIELLDGTICYSADSTGNKSFIVGQGGVESGLEEGLTMMSEGDSAIFIMPPHLAHGLIGDQNRIPARAVIVYYVKLDDVQ